MSSGVILALKSNLRPPEKSNFKQIVTRSVYFLYELEIRLTSAAFSVASSVFFCPTLVNKRLDTLALKPNSVQLTARPGK